MISKSGNTIEPAIAFRIQRFLKRNMEKKEAKNVFIAQTDKGKGTLKQLADAEGYQTFVVPDDVGYQFFSVLTAVRIVTHCCLRRQIL